MPKSRIQRIQDSIHGLMEFKGMESVVIDILRTRELQRLRRIRQLGLAYLVFPGAEHSRLVHSLGSSYLSIIFCKQLIESNRDFYAKPLLPNEESIRDLAVAALCHDLGHGPFSHAWEKEIVGERFDRKSWIKKLGVEKEEELLIDAKWHEITGHAILTWEDGELYKILETNERGFSKRLSFLLRGKYFPPYFPNLISGDIDVDRADWVRRDTHQCGVAYGKYDLDWLVSTCKLGENSSGKLVFGFDKNKSLRVVEQFLIARRALYDTVYSHKTVKSAEGMAKLFLRRLKEVLDEININTLSDFIRPLLKMVSGEPVSVDELLKLDDFSLWILIENIANKPDIDVTVRDLAKRILARDLFKYVPCHPKKVSEFLQREDAYPKIYETIEPFCPGSKEYYILRDKVEYSVLSDKEEEMGYFIDEDRNAIPFKEHEELRSFYKKKEEYVRIFTISEAVDSLKNLIESTT